MNLYWTEKASADALSIHAFIAESSNAYADSDYERILGRPQQLIPHPMSDSIVPEFGLEDIRELFVDLKS